LVLDQYHGRNWIVIKIRHGPMRVKHTPIWWILQTLRTNLVFHPYYMTPPSLRTNNVIFSYIHYREHCEDQQWNQRKPNALLNSKITFSRSENVQCWRYNYDPKSCVEQSRTYCNPTMGRLENLLQTSETGNWPDELGYESLCKAYLKGQVPRSSMQRNYRELINQNPMSRFINANWFSLNINRFVQQDNEDLVSYTNISSLETMKKMMPSRFDNQSNYTLDKVRIYEQYDMKRRIFYYLEKQMDDQIYLYENVYRQSPLYRKKVRCNQKGQQAHESQQWLTKIIKKHVQLLRENLEGYYIFRMVQKYLFALDNVTDLHQDIIYQHQFRNGKKLSVSLSLGLLIPLPLPRSC